MNGVRARPVKCRVFRQLTVEKTAGPNGGGRGSAVPKEKTKASSADRQPDRRASGHSSDSARRRHRPRSRYAAVELGHEGGRRSRPRHRRGRRGHPRGTVARTPVPATGRCRAARTPRRRRPRGAPRRAGPAPGGPLRPSPRRPRPATSVASKRPAPRSAAARKPRAAGVSRKTRSAASSRACSAPSSVAGVPVTTRGAAPVRARRGGVPEPAGTESEGGLAAARPAAG